MRLDPQTRSELFLQYEAAGYLELEPEEREALLGPKQAVKKPVRCEEIPLRRHDQLALVAA